MGVFDRLFGTKAAQPSGVPALPVVSGFNRWAFEEPTFERLNREGYASNAAVFQCVGALSFGYNEPPPMVVDGTGEPQPAHPLQPLLDRPNPIMSHAELMTYIITYKAVGGNCYLYKRRNSRGQTVELWPYHAGQMRPLPSRENWIDAYEYWPQGMLTLESDRVVVPAADIIHLKWPTIDLDQPWLAMPPLRAVAREVDSDSEMTRYIYALLMNDAVVRTVLTIPAGANLGDKQYERLAEQFSIRHGGNRRGGVGIVEGGATISRMGLNLQELSIEALRRIPESRIAGAFRVPAILAGLYVGLEKATYSNYAEARKQFTEGTLVPLWKSDAIELTQALLPEFGGKSGYRVDYDLKKVAALQEAESEKYTRAILAFDKGVLTKNETRAYLGYQKIGQIVVEDAGDTFDGQMQTDTSATDPAVPQEAKGPPILGYHIDAGVVSRNEARAQLLLPPEDDKQSDKLRSLKESLAVVQTAVAAGFPLDIAVSLVGMPVAVPPTDVTPPPAMLMDQQTAAKALIGLALREMKASSTAPLERRIERALTTYFKAQYEQAAQEVS